MKGRHFDLCLIERRVGTRGLTAAIARGGFRVFRRKTDDVEMVGIVTDNGNLVSICVRYEGDSTRVGVDRFGRANVGKWLGREEYVIVNVRCLGMEGYNAVTVRVVFSVMHFTMSILLLRRQVGTREIWE